MSLPPWRTEGLVFTCQACGACCIGDGFAYLCPDDVDRLADGLGCTRQELADGYLAPLEVRFDDGEVLPYLVLRKDAGGRCVFLNDEGRCGVHAFKPGQCKDSPCIPEFLCDEENYHAFASVCPGLGVGPAVPPGALRVLVERHATRQLAYEEALEACGGDLAVLYRVTLPKKPWLGGRGCEVDTHHE